MKTRIFTLLLCLFIGGAAMAQTAPLKKVYDEKIDRMAQVDEALKKAGKEGKYVMVQLGGNWCPWCLIFADFIEKNADLKQQMDKNFVYIHVDYSPAAKRQPNHKELMKRLGNPARFGFPVLVVLNKEGKVVHIQDSGLLEQGKGYDKGKVLRFLQIWSPAAVEAVKE